MSNVATFRHANADRAGAQAPAAAELHHLAFADAFVRAHADNRRHWARRSKWMAWTAGEGWREAS